VAQNHAAYLFELIKCYGRYCPGQGAGHRLFMLAFPTPQVGRTVCVGLLIYKVVMVAAQEYEVFIAVLP